MKGVQKKTSKRMTLNKKHKIEKKVREHHRKTRKEAKKMKQQGLVKTKKKNDLGLPNIYPFKKKIMEAFERKKENEQRKKQLEKLKKKEKLNEMSEEMLMKSVNQAVIYENDMIKNQKEESKSENHIKNPNKKISMKDLTKVIESADIILEVLDARDPLGCRNRDLEAKILGMPGDKKIILVLNKIDLVPIAAAERWLKYLRREFATVLFKANTQSQNDHLGSAPIFKSSLSNRQELTKDLLSSSKAIGPDHLIEIIKNYSKHEGIKTSVTVGLVGYPNVGKSSVINSLTMSKSASVSSIPGHTKNMQEIVLDSKVKLLDCPGIVFSMDDEKLLVLRNIIKPEDVKDPIAPIEEILNRVDHNQLLIKYEIPEFSNLSQFLMNVAHKRGKLMKGGIPDLEAAARVILHDWNAGKLDYYTLPPDEEIMDEGPSARNGMETE